MKKLLLALLFAFSCHVPAHAQDRALRVAMSYESLLSSSFGETLSPGPGVSATYEFRLTPRFALGVNLAYRTYAGSPGISQLGYGLLMRHGFELSEHWSPYFAYGLLLQVHSVSDRPYSGTAHDTALCLGSDFRGFGPKLFFEIAYHISHLRYFESPVLNVSYGEAKLGWEL